MSGSWPAKIPPQNQHNTEKSLSYKIRRRLIPLCSGQCGITYFGYHSYSIVWFMNSYFSHEIISIPKAPPSGCGSGDKSTPPQHSHGALRLCSLDVHLNCSAFSNLPHDSADCLMLDHNQLDYMLDLCFEKKKALTAYALESWKSSALMSAANLMMSSCNSNQLISFHLCNFNKCQRKKRFELNSPHVCPFQRR